MIDIPERPVAGPRAPEPPRRGAPPAVVPDAGAPTQPGQRLAALDVLRGFALLGILLVNMALFTHSFYAQVLGLGAASSPLDQLARWAIAFFAEGKFYSIFAFLFGLGTALQYARFQQRGRPFVPFYLRRLGVLLLIGLAHAYLFWVGDILILYAVLGTALLLLFRNRRPRTLLVWTGILLLIPLLLNAGLLGLVELGRLAGDPQAVEQALLEQTRQLGALGAEADEVYATGSFVEVTRQRASDMSFVFATWPFMAFNVLAMMVLGLAVGKGGLLDNLPAQLPLLRRVWWWGLLVGVAGNLLYVVGGEASVRSIPSVWLLASLAGQTLGAPALSLFYMSSIVLLMQRAAWERRLRPLAPVGRMAISNYLLQTVICTTLFYGYGFGLYGQVGSAAGVVLTLALFALQVPLSVWWLGQFRFGPVEWLWRSLSYGRWQPMRSHTRVAPQPSR